MARRRTTVAMARTALTGHRLFQPRAAVMALRFDGQTGHRADFDLARGKD
jgi:hypothetical protein